MYYYSYYNSYSNIQIYVDSFMMKTIQITVDESLLRHVNSAIVALRTTRSAFIRQSLEEALRRLKALRLEARHRRGYMKKPVSAGEVVDWESEQAWGDQ